MQKEALFCLRNLNPFRCQKVKHSSAIQHCCFAVLVKEFLTGSHWLFWNLKNVGTRNAENTWKHINVVLASCSGYPATQLMRIFQLWTHFYIFARQPWAMRWFLWSYLQGYFTVKQVCLVLVISEQIQLKMCSFSFNFLFIIIFSYLNYVRL